MTRLPASTAASAAAAPAPDAPGPDAAPGPLAPEHLHALTIAQQRGRRLRRAVGVASFSGWTTWVFAIMTILMGVFDLVTLLLGLALAVVAWNELEGAKQLRRLEEGAPRRLAWGQVGLAGAIIVYAAWGLYATFTGPNPYEEYVLQGGQVADMIEPFAQLHTLISVAVYAALIVGTVALQGGAAWYYASRARHLRAYVLQTPPWILQLQRRGSAV